MFSLLLYMFDVRWIFGGIPTLISFIGCVIIMLGLCYAVVTNSQQSSRYRTAWQRGAGAGNEDNGNFFQRLLRLFGLGSGTSSSAHPQAEQPSQQQPQQRRSQTEATTPTNQSIFNSRTTRQSANARTNKEVIIQACLFILAFIGTCLFTYINRITEQIHGSSPFWLQFLARTLLSLQGNFLRLKVYLLQTLILSIIITYCLPLIDLISVLYS